MRYGKFLLCLAVLPCAGQSTGTASASGQCNEVNTGNNNTFNITCGIGKQQGDQMIKILNRILADQLDPTAVMSKLGEMQKGIDDIKKSTSRIEQKTNAASVRRSLSESQQRLLYAALDGSCNDVALPIALIWEPFDEPSDYAGYFEKTLSDAKCLGYRSELRS